MFCAGAGKSPARTGCGTSGASAPRVGDPVELRHGAASLLRRGEVGEAVEGGVPLLGEAAVGWAM